MRLDSAIHPAHESDTKSKTPVASSAAPATPSKSVQNSVTLDFSEVPKRYRRRPLTEEEIDLVAVRSLLSTLTLTPLSLSSV